MCVCVCGELPEQDQQAVDELLEVDAATGHPDDRVTLINVKVVINQVAFCPRKPETVRKTTPELLSAVLRNVIGC